MFELKNIEKIRDFFPVTNNLVYFDHAAVAPIHTESLKAINEYTEDLINNGIRNYKHWFEETERIRKGMADFINADEEEIAFIKNTSQGISIVAGGLEFSPGDNIVIPDIEFPANVYPWLNLQSNNIKVKFVESVDGKIPLERIADAVDKNTRLVSVSSVEFSSGYRNDLNAISRLCKDRSAEYSRKIYFHVDAIQSMGALKIDVKADEIDFMSADGHKWFLTPEGAGIFYCNKNSLSSLHPCSVGWKSVNNPLNFSDINFDLQQTARKFEEGSLNTMGIVALGASLNLFNSVGIETIENKIINLACLATKALEDKGYTVTSPLEDKYRSGIITFKGLYSIEDKHKHFIDNFIQLSLRGGNIRISPHFYNTEEEINKFKALL